MKGGTALLFSIFSVFVFFVCLFSFVLFFALSHSFFLFSLPFLSHENPVLYSSFLP